MEALNARIDEMKQESLRLIEAIEGKNYSELRAISKEMKENLLSKEEHEVVVLVLENWKKELAKIQSGAHIAYGGADSTPKMGRHSKTPADGT
jgi:hypothetical protein